MIGRLLSLILLSTVSLIEMNEGPQQISLIVVKPGDNVTLTCDVSKDLNALFYWHKLNFKFIIEKIASYSFGKMLFEEKFNNSRFSATKVANVHFLTIRNVSKEHEATYYCQAGSSFKIKFINGTVLTVNDPKTQKSVTVKQTPDVESVHLDDTMTLQCSLLSRNKNDTVECPGEDKVHWFKGGSESHPGIIYHGGIRKREKGRCDYSLLRTIMSSSDAGTYYCGVATCGEILFGEGIKMEINGFPLINVLVIQATLLTCSVIVNLVLILARKKKQTCEHCKGKVTGSNNAEQEKSPADQASSEDGEEVELNYVALDFPTRKSSRWKSKKESPEYTIYSGVRECQ
ncbi:signal-regulatory protein beta-2-like [Archocentrus centrarchus]|uniref:signal-regulatory protein beta-2-like n=1 Tax=Archocentrus centrarchus TaxID=63155 RepID=UPI0011EA438B|nr:signal-regulatory protein beta-2-like [Archocentrus centrarchus]